MPDKKADSIADAIKHVRGERNIERFYSDRSGEIERALRDLHIVSDTSQLVFPRTKQTRSVLCKMSWKELGQGYYGPGFRHVSGNTRASTIA